MARQDCLDVTLRQFPQSVVTMLCKSRPLRADFAKRMMDGNQNPRTLRQRIDLRQAPFQRARADPALRPIEARLHANRGLKRHDGKRAEIQLSLDLFLHAAKPLVRCGKPLKQIEVRQVVIAHADGNGRIQ